MKVVCQECQGTMATWVRVEMVVTKAAPDLKDQREVQDLLVIKDDKEIQA